MDYQPLIERWSDGTLKAWAEILTDQVAAGLSRERYGDLPRWLDALAGLPAVDTARVHLDRDAVGADAAAPPDAATLATLRARLMDLHPWRKGPFDLFGVHIDTEWHSDWKWQRLLPGLEPLAGRRVLDVGCGSGYHCWRMLGAGAAEVIGIDPTPLFVVQFWALQHYLRQDGIWVLPLGIEQVPPRLAAFDTVFSLGVLYHRRSPIDHLRELRQTLKPGGRLVLETLYLPGEGAFARTPGDRYARMRNVWLLPSIDELLTWLHRTGFSDMVIADRSVTSTDEQRTTDWMDFESLQAALDPLDPKLTIEGWPRPHRVVLTATTS